MFARSRSRKATRAKPAQRPAGAGPLRRGSMRWLIELVSLCWRRRAAAAPALEARIEPAAEATDDEPIPLLRQQQTELRARLLVHDPATHVVRNLFVVHHELRANGWPGVEALPIKLLSRAVTEAEILGIEEPSPVMQTIVSTLRELKEAAEARVAEEALEPDWETMQVPEVSDTNFGEYELAERSWAGTVPAGLEIKLRGI